jgi:hypothetical protein
MDFRDSNKQRKKNYRMRSFIIPTLHQIKYEMQTACSTDIKGVKCILNLILNMKGTYHFGISEVDGTIILKGHERTGVWGVNCFQMV